MTQNKHTFISFHFISFHFISFHFDHRQAGDIYHDLILAAEHLSNNYDAKIYISQLPPRQLLKKDVVAELNGLIANITSPNYVYVEQNLSEKILCDEKHIDLSNIKLYIKNLKCKMRKVLGMPGGDERVRNRSNRSRSSRDTPRNQWNQRTSYGNASNFDGPENNRVKSWSHYNQQENKQDPKEQFIYPTKGSKQQGHQHYKQSQNDYNNSNGVPQYNAVQYSYPTDPAITRNEREEVLQTLITLLRNK